MENYYVDISLSRWAIINYSSDLWKRPDLKIHLANLAMQQYHEKEDIIPSDLHDELNKLILPTNLKFELKLAIGSMGDRILSWLEWHLRIMKHGILADSIDFIDYIRWNYLGCVDLIATATSLYKSGILAMDLSTWRLLCRHCDEECILDFWNKISNIHEYHQLKELVLHSELSRDHDHLVVYWKLRMQNRLDIFKEQVNGFDDLETVDQFMFRESHVDNYQTFIYFWNRLDENERKSILNKMASARHSWNWLNVPLYKYMDYFMFNIRQYSSYGFEDVVVKMLDDDIQEMLIWPCLDNFLPALKTACNKDVSLFWSNIMWQLIDFMGSEKAFVGKESRVRNIFNHVWANKVMYKCEMLLITESIIDLCIDRDMELLKYMVTHETSPEERLILLDHIFDEINPRSNFEILKKFVNEISDVDDVYGWFLMRLFNEDIDFDMENLWEG